jgi:hypothetical protein
MNWKNKNILFGNHVKRDYLRDEGTDVKITIN